MENPTEPTREDPSHTTLRGIPAAPKAGTFEAWPSEPEDRVAREFKREFNQALVALGLKIIANGRREGRIQHVNIDCVWHLKSAGLAYQLRYLGREPIGDDSAWSGLLRGAAVSDSFAPMTELPELARQLAATLVLEKESVPSRIAAHRQHIEAVAKWNRDRAAADARAAAAQQAAVEEKREADRKIAEEVARQAREREVFERTRCDAAALKEVLPEGWSAEPTESSHPGNLVLWARSLPPDLVRELAAVLPVIDRDASYVELRTFLEQVRQWRARDESDQQARFSAELNEVFAEVDREKEERRRDESSLFGRAMRFVGLGKARARAC